MSSFELVALVAVALWLAGLTLLVLLLVRQLGIMSVRLSVDAPRVEGSIPIGGPLPDAVTEEFPELSDDLAYLVFLSSTCAACADFARNLDLLPSGRRILVFVAGTGESADRLHDLVPESFETIRDPVATAMADAMELRGTPIALQVERGILTGRAIGTRVEEIRRLFDAYDASDARQLATSMREVLDSARS